MSHTFTAESTLFISNSDLSGDVEIVRGDERISVPGDDLIDFIADYIRYRKIAELEIMTPLEILGLTPCK